jgi:hypothetical protein
VRNTEKDIKLEQRILIEIGKIKANLRILWDLSKPEKLERNRCLNIAREIEKSLAIIKGLLKNPTIESKLLFLHSHLSFYIESSAYSDRSLRSLIAEFCQNLENIIILLEDEFGVRSELLLLAEFSSLFPTFTSNWIVATIYLTAMEISVKTGLRQRGKEIKDNFKENFQLLLSCLKGEIEITELEKLLPPLFWNIRNRIIHEGYSPTDEELEIIGEYVIKLMSKL